MRNSSTNTGVELTNFWRIFAFVNQIVIGERAVLDFTYGTDECKLMGHEADGGTIRVVPGRSRSA